MKRSNEPDPENRRRICKSRKFCEEFGLQSGSHLWKGPIKAELPLGRCVSACPWPSSNYAIDPVEDVEKAKSFPAFCSDVIELNEKCKIYVQNRVCTTYFAPPASYATKQRDKKPGMLSCSMTNDNFISPSSLLRTMGFMGPQFRAQKKFTKLMLRMTLPGTDFKETILIFQSTKIVGTGAKNKEASDFVMNYVLSVLGKHCGLPDIRIHERALQNIVATGFLSFSLDLKGMSKKLSYVTYRPKKFAGATIKHPDPKCTKITMLAFPKGTVICVGAKSSEELRYAYKSIFPVFEKNKLLDSTDVPPSNNKNGKRKKIEKPDRVSKKDEKKNQRARYRSRYGNF